MIFFFILSIKKTLYFKTLLKSNNNSSRKIAKHLVKGSEMGNTQPKPKTNIELFTELCVNSAKDLGHGKSTQLTIPDNVDAKKPDLVFACNKTAAGIRTTVENGAVNISRANEYLECVHQGIDKMKVNIRKNNTGLSFTAHIECSSYQESFLQFVRKIKSKSSGSVYFSSFRQPEICAILNKDEVTFVITHKHGGPIFTTFPAGDVVGLFEKASGFMRPKPTEDYYDTDVGSIGCG